ncbi:MAG: sodium:alanine symporter family protein [Clostridia bacterium]|nr:sodium:alanine symporter family protein [Clostridia bacterium]
MHIDGNTIQTVIRRISGMVWGPGTVAVMLGIGLYFMIQSRFLPFRRPDLWLTGTVRQLFQRERTRPGTITRRQALATALAGTMGTGNIAGVATAISLGGPGAVFWMWVSGCAGMMLKYAETVLAVRFRRRNAEGSWQGGAMEVMTYGLRMPVLAAIYAGCCMLASFGMGNMAQSNTIAQSLQHAFHLPPAWTAAGCALCVGLVVCGGVRRIAQVAEAAIPALSLLYGIGGLTVIVCHMDRLGPALAEIVSGALTGQAAAGGAAGAGIAAAMRHGFSAGIFSNEAGLGSSGMVYAAAEDADPAEQGLWGMFEVFVDTMVVCTITALAILTSGAREGGQTGAELTIAAFETVFGAWGSAIVAVSIALFALASMLGWAYYGERSCRALSGGTGRGYRVLFIGAAALGCLMRLEAVWGLSEIFNGLMAVPNLITLVLLAPVVRAITAEKTGGIRRKIPEKKRKKFEKTS